jgi:DNA polymerase-3 subunit delta'
MSFASSLPAELRDSRPVRVLDASLAKGRLPHGILLHGSDLGGVRSVALALAGKLLNRPAATVTTHPDCFELRPGKKSRVITVDETRDLIRTLYQTSREGGAKVAIINEADRFRTEAANAFLKTLEEPPAHTTLLLLTTRPYALLPTIRSRVLQFRFPSLGIPLAADGWTPWLEDYCTWLGRLTAGVADKRAAADHIFTLYGLVARFGAVLDFATGEVWKQQKEKLPPDLDDDEQVAIETGIANGLRSRLFAEIEQATRTFALPRLTRGDEVTRRALTASIEKLEHNAGLLRLNLNESAALEDFLLSSLRLWTKR